MSKIEVLDKNTINKIAAGEVVERPASVVKELIENAIDAGANAITAEIKEGGIGFIRITDNGAGIEKDDIKVAFLRHATSKIRSVEDLLTIGSLGFRGEALSSISAVAMVELVTKTRAAFTGNRYVIEGGEDKGLSEIGCPDGTTFLIRNLFYNTPARRKFLKSPMTEAGYISDLMERLAVSHPDISFKFINNNKTLLHTSGNHNLKDIIYHVYGRDIAAQLVPVVGQNEFVTMEGYIGKPIISRGNRNYENYFINGRYIKSGVISKAIEEAYRPYTMQHKYPFTAIHFTIDPEIIDVNVHPTKMEIRFTNSEMVYRMTYRAISDALAGKNMIPDVALVEEKRKQEKRTFEHVPEPFEANRIKESRERIKEQAEKKRNEAILSMQKSNLFGGSLQEKKKEEEKIPDIIKDTEIVKLKEAQLLAPELVQERLENQAQSVESKTENTIKEETMVHAADVLKADVSENKGGTEVSLKASTSGKAADDLDSLKGSAPEKTILSTAELLKESSLEELFGTSPEIDPKALAALSDTAKNHNTGSSADTENDSMQNDKLKEGKTEAPRQLSFIEERKFTDDMSQKQESSEAVKEAFMIKENVKRHRIIGQLFATYWLVEMDSQLFIIDQHAAHEKILYETTLKRKKDKEFLSQMISPPIVLSLSLKEEAAVMEHMDILKELGFEIEHFGGKEYAVSALPADMYGIAGERLLIDFIDDLVEEAPRGTPEIIFEKIASMSCKAAVKGNQKLSYMEAESLIDQLLSLDNPFHCPHGRPVIISMTKYEIEKKFKRII